MQVGVGSMIFMQEKGGGGHIILCTHFRELCYTKGVKQGCR